MRLEFLESGTSKAAIIASRRDQTNRRGSIHNSQTNHGGSKRRPARGSIKEAFGAEEEAADPFLEEHACGASHEDGEEGGGPPMLMDCGIEPFLERGKTLGRGEVGQEKENDEAYNQQGAEGPEEEKHYVTQKSFHLSPRLAGDCYCAAHQGAGPSKAQVCGTNERLLNAPSPPQRGAAVVPQTEAPNGAGTRSYLGLPVRPGPLRLFYQIGAAQRARLKSGSHFSRDSGRDWRCEGFPLEVSIQTTSIEKTARILYDRAMFPENHKNDSGVHLDVGRSLGRSHLERNGMQRHPFGKRSGFSVPRVNIGAMRLPDDEDEAIGLIRYAIDSGMAYIDTSRGYGSSEMKVGKALKDGYREKVILSTKWSPWNLKVEETDAPTADCTRKRLEECMRRLDVDHLDYFQIWSINNRGQYDQAVAKGGMLDGIRSAMDEGLVGHTGFTTHDTPESVISYIDEVNWCEIALFTYNLLNTRYAPAIQAAHEIGIGTIVMNPMGGGRLAEPSEVLEALAGEVGCGSVPEMALRFLLTNPAIDTLIPGISNKSDVDDAVAAANAGGFTPPEMALIEAFQERVSRKTAGFCTSCEYCLPCPSGIHIPSIMTMIYEERYWGMRDTARRRYARMHGPKADACVECGSCEEKCTQNLEIIKELREAHERFI